MTYDKVVIVVFDGLRPDCVTPQRMPRLAAFAAHNKSFSQARSVFPSMTRVATTSIATGAPPSIHGIVGNQFYFPEVTRDFVLDMSLASDIAAAEAVLDGPLITAPTFADMLAKAGKSCAVVHLGSAGSAYCINPRAADHGHWTFSIHGEDHTRTPHAVREAIARFGPLPPRDLPRFAEIDYGSALFIEHVLNDMQPDVALIWLNEPDTSFHYKSLSSAPTEAVLGHVDAAFGRICDAIAARPDADRVLLIAASDHGQISSYGSINVAAQLTAAGHAAASAAQRDLQGAKLAVTGGNMGEIRFLDGDMDRRAAVVKWLCQQEWIGMLFSPSDDPVFGEAPGTLSLKSVMLDHARAPELAYILHSDLKRDPFGYPGNCLITGGVPVGGGMHGGLNRHELNTFLALGTVQSADMQEPDSRACGIIDIAPTVLAALNLQPAATMQGQSLLEQADQNVAPHSIYVERGGFKQKIVLASRNHAQFVMHGGRYR